MKKLYAIFTIVSVGFLSSNSLNAKENVEKKSKIIGTNPYTYSPRIFTAENGATGQFWAGDGTKKYPGKAFLGEIEYTNVIALPKDDIETKANKKLRKNKQYLGSYIEQTSTKIFYLYGTKKTPDKIDNSPDADVLTQIAIKEDYGPGE